MNLKTAKAKLAEHGMTIRKRDGEYRVTFKGWPTGRAEDVAHYTDDIEDAVSTGLHMSEEHKRNTSA
jgi:hypothetical protein